MQTDPNPRRLSIGKPTIAVILLFCSVASLSVVVGTCGRTPPQPQGPIPNRLVLYDVDGTQLLDTADRSMVKSVWASIHEAPFCARMTLWNPRDNVAKLLFRFSDGAKRQFVLVGADRVMEVGPAPDRACRNLNTQELMDRLLKTNELP